MILTQEYSRVASTETRAWMISPQGKIHPCGDDHETYIYEHPEEFAGEVSGLVTSYALTEEGWIRVGAINNILYIDTRNMLTATTLKLLQDLAKEISAPFKRVELHKPNATSSYFTKEEFAFATLKDVNRRGIAHYARRRATIEDHRGQVYDPEATDYLSIGHGPLGEKRSYYIWAWINGVLDVKGPYRSHWRETPDHEETWGMEISLVYRGRYDELTGEVSVAVPERWQHRGIPSSLMSRLEQEFHPTKVHLF